MVEVEAKTFAGVVRALHTLRQVGEMYKIGSKLTLAKLTFFSEGKRGFLLAGLSISDTPRLAHRGLLIDTGRSFLR